MIIPRGIGIDVLPFRPSMTHRTAIALLSQWMMAEFEPVACRAILEGMLADPMWGITEEAFRPGAILEGGVVATDALLYPRVRPLVRIVRLDGIPSGLQEDHAWREDIDFSPGDSSVIGQALRLLTQTDDLASFRAMGPVLGEQLLADLARPLVAPAAPKWPRVDGPGIYRREHGSVIIRSRTTSVILDPLGFWPRYAHAPINLDGPPVDAIFITHGHFDHWNIASILRYAASPATPVIVPKVPRVSIMSWSDMEASLKMMGQHVIAPEWGTTLKIGDIDVEILPFYGEQATRDSPGPAAKDIRNWGSCYRFDTPDFSAVTLIDSGTDPEGDMADVVRASAERRGPIDVIMSSLPVFRSPFFFGLPDNYLTLPFAQLQELYRAYALGKLPSVTPGPEGVATTCAACDARYYLPYGNGYEGVGVPIGDVGISIGDPPEVEVIAIINDRLKRAGVKTIAVAWNPGDVVTIRGGELVRHPYEPGLRIA